MKGWEKMNVIINKNYYTNKIREISLEEYIKKCIVKTMNEKEKITKKDLITIAIEDYNIQKFEYDFTSNRQQQYRAIDIYNEITTKISPIEFASKYGIGVTSYHYCNKFNITKEEIEKLRKYKKIRSIKKIAVRKYNYDNKDYDVTYCNYLYDIKEYATLTQNQINKMLIELK